MKNVGVLLQLCIYIVIGNMSQGQVANRMRLLYEDVVPSAQPLKITHKQVVLQCIISCQMRHECWSIAFKTTKCRQYDKKFSDLDDVWFQGKGFNYKYIEGDDLFRKATGYKYYEKEGTPPVSVDETRAQPVNEVTKQTSIVPPTTLTGTTTVAPTTTKKRRQPAVPITRPPRRKKSKKFQQKSSTTPQPTTIPSTISTITTTSISKTTTAEPITSVPKTTQPPPITTTRSPKTRPPPTTTTRSPKTRPPPTTTTRSPKTRPPPITTTHSPKTRLPPTTTPFPTTTRPPKTITTTFPPTTTTSVLNPITTTAVPSTTGVPYIRNFPPTTRGRWPFKTRQPLPVTTMPPTTIVSVERVPPVTRQYMWSYGPRVPITTTLIPDVPVFVVETTSTTARPTISEMLTTTQVANNMQTTPEPTKTASTITVSAIAPTVVVPTTLAPTTPAPSTTTPAPTTTTPAPTTTTPAPTTTTPVPTTILDYTTSTITKPEPTTISTSVTNEPTTILTSETNEHTTISTAVTNQPVTISTAEPTSLFLTTAKPAIESAQTGTQPVIELTTLTMLLETTESSQEPAMFKSVIESTLGHALKPTPEHPIQTKEPIISESSMSAETLPTLKSTSNKLEPKNSDETLPTQADFENVASQEYFKEETAIPNEIPMPAGNTITPTLNLITIPQEASVTSTLNLITMPQETTSVKPITTEMQQTSEPSSVITQKLVSEPPTTITPVFTSESNLLPQISTSSKTMVTINAQSTSDESSEENVNSERKETSKPKSVESTALPLTPTANITKENISENIEVSATTITDSSPKPNSPVTSDYLPHTEKNEVDIATHLSNIDISIDMPGTNKEIENTSETAMHISTTSAEESDESANKSSEMTQATNELVGNLLVSSSISIPESSINTISSSISIPESDINTISATENSDPLEIFRTDTDKSTINSLDTIKEVMDTSTRENFGDAEVAGLPYGVSEINTITPASTVPIKASSMHPEMIAIESKSEHDAIIKFENTSTDSVLQTNPADDKSNVASDELLKVSNKTSELTESHFENQMPGLRSLDNIQHISFTQDSEQHGMANKATSDPKETSRKEPENVMQDSSDEEQAEEDLLSGKAMSLTIPEVP